MEPPLNGKVAIVTGATGGIGWATARRLAEDGAKVIAVGRNDNKLKELAASHPDIAAHRADVAEEDSVRGLFDRTQNEFGRLDVVLNGAGIVGENALIENQDMENYHQVMAINVTGTFLMMKYTIPLLRRLGGGAIINVGSAAGVQAGRATMPVYCASKHAVVGLTRVAAKAHAGEGIRINVICPGQIDTDMLAAVEQDMMETVKQGSSVGSVEEARKKVIAAIPAGRYGRPDEVAALVAFLSRDDAHFINGSIYTIDGGFTPF